MKGALLVAGVLAGCSSDGPPYGTLGGGHGTTHSAAASGSASGASASTGSSTGSTGVSGTRGTTSGTATGTSTGTTTGGGQPLTCPATLSDCDAGFELLAQVYIAYQNQPVGQAVQVNDLLNPNLDTATDSNGVLRMCLSPGTVLAPEAQVNSYVYTIFNDIVMDRSQCFPTLNLFTNAVWTEVQSYIPNLDANQAAILVAINGLHCDLAGWTVWAAQADGGALPASVGYAVGLMFDPTRSATTSDALALLYNIDPSIGTVRVLASQDAGPKEAGKVACGEVLPGNTDGLVQIAGNGIVSNFAFAVTDAG